MRRRPDLSSKWPSDIQAGFLRTLIIFGQSVTDLVFEEKTFKLQIGQKNKILFVSPTADFTDSWISPTVGLTINVDLVALGWFADQHHWIV